MAFWDFIKQLHLNDEEEKKRREQGGVGNKIFGFLDDTFDTVGDAGKSVNNFATRTVGHHVIERTKDVAGAAAGLGREVIVKPATELIATVEEKQHDNTKANQLKLIKDLQAVKPEDRPRWIKENSGLYQSFMNDPKISEEDKKKWLSSSKYKDLESGKIELDDQNNTFLFGNIFKDGKKNTLDFKDNAALEEYARKLEEGDRSNDEGRKSTNTWDRQVFGNEPIQSVQGRYEGLKRDTKEGGAGWGTVPAVIGTGINVALDSPISLGLDDVVKSIGKGGIKELEKAGTEEAVKKVLTGKVKDEIVERIAPLIAKTTDKKAIEGLIKDTTSTVARRAQTGKTAQELIDEGIAKFTQKTKVNEFVDAAGAPLKTSFNPSTVTPPASTVTPPKGTTSYGPEADKVRSLFKTSSEVEDMAKKPSRWDSVKQQFYDKLTPMHKLVKEVESRTGQKIATEDNPYELMRLYAGMPAAIKQRLGTVSSVLEDSGDLDAVRIVGMARRTLGRPDISSTISLEDAKRAIAQVEGKLGPEAFAKVNGAVDDIVKYNEDLLKELGDAGVFSKEAVDEIISKNPDYFARFQVVNKLLEGMGSDIYHSGQSFNLSKQQVVKAMEGMKEGTQILDPIEAIVKSTDLSMRTIAKNRIWQSLYKLSDQAPDLIHVVRNPEDVAKRMELSLENKELRPVRDKLDRMMRTRGRWVSKLQTEINNLEKKGMQKSLKEGGQTMPKFSIEGFGGTVPTSQAGKAVPVSEAEDALMKSIDGEAAINPSKLGPQDTVTFLRNLVQGPNKEIIRLKKMVAHRDPQLAKLLDEIQGMKGEYDDLAGTIKANREEAQSLADLKTPDGFSVVSGMDNGVGGQIAIPKEMADVYKGMTPSQMNYLTKIVSSVNRVMKEAVTSLSLPFAFIRNPIRDFKSMATNSDSIEVRKIGSAWVKGFASAFKHDDMYERWIKAGGGGAGIYSNIDSAEKIAKDLGKKAHGTEIHSVEDLFKTVQHIATTPFRAIRSASSGIQKAGATLEAAPRLAEFKAAVGKGLSDQEAALASRNVTVDFNQSGTVGQVMNQWVPFLNARLQGNIKMVQAAKKNPQRFAGVYATLTAAPILATAAMNQQFPDVLAQIDQNTKDNNFLIIFGDEQDKDGNFTQVMKIPKGDMDKVFGTPLENFVNYFAGNDAKGFAQVVTEMLGNLSPIDTVKDGKFNVSRAVGSLLPVALKVPVEQATNKNLYNDSPIVNRSMENLPNEMQVKDSTSPVAKFLAGLTGASPLKTQQAIQDTTGTLLTRTPNSSLASSVVGASDNATTNEFYAILSKTDKMKNGASKEINVALADGDTAKAQQIADAYNQEALKAVLPWFKRYGKYADKKTLEELDTIVINLSSRSIKQRQRSNQQAALEKAGR